MRSLLLCLICAAAAFSADDAWNKVRQLKSGTEVRITKRESRQPVLAKFDEADEDRILVVLKNEQIAIAKDDIERIDFRPQGGSRVTRETKTTTGNPDARASTPSRPSESAGPGGNYSSNVSIGSKPDFETLYRRPPKSPKPATPPQ